MNQIIRTLDRNILFEKDKNDIIDALRRIFILYNTKITDLQQNAKKCEDVVSLRDKIRKYEAEIESLKDIIEKIKPMKKESKPKYNVFIANEGGPNMHVQPSPQGAFFSTSWIPNVPEPHNWDLINEEKFKPGGKYYRDWIPKLNIRQTSDGKISLDDIKILYETVMKVLRVQNKSYIDANWESMLIHPKGLQATAKQIISIMDDDSIADEKKEKLVSELYDDIYDDLMGRPRTLAPFIYFFIWLNVQDKTNGKKYADQFLGYLTDEQRDTKMIGGDNYKMKYLKYKTKYLLLKKMV